MSAAGWRALLFPALLLRRRFGFISVVTLRDLRDALSQRAERSSNAVRVGEVHKIFRVVMESEVQDKIKLRRYQPPVVPPIATTWDDESASISQQRNLVFVLTVFPKNGVAWRLTAEGPSRPMDSST